MDSVKNSADMRQEGAGGRLQELAEAGDFGWREGAFFEHVGSAAEDPFPAHQGTELERAKIFCNIVEDLVYEFLGKLGGHGQGRETLCHA